MTALDGLARLAEEAGLNASTPPQEARIDGWLLRLSPGKAKRSRCVNALAAGTLPLDELLERCRISFDAAGLPLIVRVTPFSQPADLDDHLAAMGWFSFDAADVMVLDSLPDADTTAVTALDAQAYAALVGGLRGSSPVEISAHAERLLASPVAYRGFDMRGEDGALLCCGQYARDGAIVGLFDIFTPPGQRGRGHAHALCAALLARARAEGASQAYLQVGSDNAVAQRVYQRLGFRFAYRYHYRAIDPRAHG
ncbi:GNAT family N-acetyltransferase [Pelomonas sp. KK5]|uniref:GNAT family N-acetyltransferase n=1 Tax=Pelomonas sp. KK5 TaxID=1855730 RepID=UPI00097C8564|nr:GNAT family N-acetyltransferase [Pelomonas sp. KK5]